MHCLLQLGRFFLSMAVEEEEGTPGRMANKKAHSVSLQFVGKSDIFSLMVTPEHL